MKCAGSSPWKGTMTDNMLPGTTVVFVIYARNVTVYGKSSCWPSLLFDKMSNTRNIAGTLKYGGNANVFKNKHYLVSNGCAR